MKNTTSWAWQCWQFIVFILALIPNVLCGQSALIIADVTTNEGRWAINNATAIARSTNIDAPVFLSGDSVLLVAIKDGDQSLLQKHSLTSRKILALATDVLLKKAIQLVPKQQGFSVLIEKGGRTSLWKYDDQGKPVRELLAAVTFQQYAWIDDNALVAINNKTLNLVTLRPFAQTEVTRNVGPTIQREYQHPSIYFVHKLANDYWLLKKVEGQSGKISTVSETLTETDVFAVASTGDLVMFNEGSFYHKKMNGEWTMIDTPKMFANVSVNHIAVSQAGTKIAVVVTPLTGSSREED